jgi:hypothetical protein
LLGLLGLGAYLVEKHFPKYGLTYYFKRDIGNPADRPYIVDEIPTAPPILSFQINASPLTAKRGDATCRMALS